MTPGERALHRRITRDLQARGTLESIPGELLLDYVFLNSRIDDLRRMAAENDDPKIKLGAYRQLEAAVTQRRQLANCLFPQPEVGKKVLRQIAAETGATASDWASLVQ